MLGSNLSRDERKEEEKTLDEKLEEQVELLAVYSSMNKQALPEGLMPSIEQICFAALENGFSEKEKEKLYKLLILFDNAIKNEGDLPTFINALSEQQAENEQDISYDNMLGLFWMAAGILFVAAVGAALPLLISLHVTAAVYTSTSSLLGIGLGLLSMCQGYRFLFPPQEKKAATLFDSVLSLFPRRGNEPPLLEAARAEEKKKLAVQRIYELKEENCIAGEIARKEGCRYKSAEAITKNADVLYVIDHEFDSIEDFLTDYSQVGYVRGSGFDSRKSSSLWVRKSNQVQAKSLPQELVHLALGGTWINNTLYVVFSNEINSVEEFLKLKEKIMAYANKNGLEVDLCSATFSFTSDKLLLLEKEGCEVDLSVNQKRNACSSVTISSQKFVKGWAGRKSNGQEVTSDLFVFIEDGQLSYAIARDKQATQFRTDIPAPLPPNNDLSACDLDPEIKFKILKMACQAGHAKFPDNVLSSISFDSTQVLPKKIKKRISEREQERVKKEKPENNRNNRNPLSKGSR